MANPGGGAAGRIDDDLDAVGGDQCGGIVGDPGRALAQRVHGGARSGALGGPTDLRGGSLCACRGQIRDTHNVYARSARSLRQKHRAKLTGADQSHANWTAGAGAIQQQLMQIHGGSGRLFLGKVA